MTERTQRPPATPDFGFVTQDGPAHVYPQTSCMRVKKLSVGRFDNNVYVIECTGAREALIVDASAPPERVIPELDGARPVGIAITHDHRDHTQHIEALHEALGAPPVYAYPAPAYGGVTPVDDGDVIRVGEIEVGVLFTPGHTPNSICLLARGHLFSGDTLFPGGPGNTNGDETRFATVMRSLDRLFELPDDTRVSPGHGLDTTIARERPHLQTWRARGW